jgi:hypothetical protein
VNSKAPPEQSSGAVFISRARPGGESPGERERKAKKKKAKKKEKKETERERERERLSPLHPPFSRVRVRER